MFGLMFISCLLSRFAFHADADRLNSSSSDTSMLLNADTTVLRQLLNQETLIRMSVVKNVDILMKDIVTLKDSMTWGEVISIKQISKDKQDYVMKELEGIKRQIHLLNDTQMIFEENLKKQNSTGLDLLNMVEKSKAEGRRFQTDTRKSLEEAKKNTTDESLDLKMQVRVLSTSLMRLNEHVQQQDKSFHELIENNYKASSDLITNASLNVQGKVLIVKQERKFRDVKFLSLLLLFYFLLFVSNIFEMTHGINTKQIILNRENQCIFT